MPPARAARRLPGFAAVLGVLATGVLGAVLLAGPADAAPANGCGTSTMQDHAKAARAVFSGTVAGSMRVDGTGANPAFSQRVEVERVYKGSIRTASVTVRTEGGACGPGGLTRGRAYLFFVTGGEGSWTAVDGTEARSPAVIAQVENLLGPGKPPVSPGPPVAVLTPVDHRDPTSLVTLALPGGILVALGLLGLVVLAARRRRRSG